MSEEEVCCSECSKCSGLTSLSESFVCSLCKRILCLECSTIHNYDASPYNLIKLVPKEEKMKYPEKRIRVHAVYRFGRSCDDCFENNGGIIEAVQKQGALNWWEAKLKHALEREKQE